MYTDSSRRCNPERTCCGVSFVMTSPKSWFSNLDKTWQILLAIAGLLVLGGSSVTVVKSVASVPLAISAVQGSVDKNRVHSDSTTYLLIDALRDIRTLQREQVCLQISQAKHRDIDPCLLQASDDTRTY